MLKMESKVVVVTGANSDISLEIIKVLAIEGFLVVGVSRHVDRVTELVDKLRQSVDVATASNNIVHIACDVTDGADVQRMFDHIHSKHGGVDIIVNCAEPIHTSKILMDGDTNQLCLTIEANHLLSTCICTREAIKSMRARDGPNHNGHIVVVSSHHQPSIDEQCKTVICADELVDKLRKELCIVNSKIKVTRIKSNAGIDNEDSDLNEIYKLTQTPYLFECTGVANAVKYALCSPSSIQIEEIAIRTFPDLD